MKKGSYFTFFFNFLVMTFYFRTSLNNDFDLFASAPSATPVAQPQPSNWGQLAQPQPVQSNGNNNTSQPKNDTWSFMEQQ